VGYADMLLTDSITLIWNGDKTSIGAAAGNAAKSVDFNVPVNLIAAAMGKSIEVSYEVTRDGEVLPSSKLTLTVGTLSEADLGQSKPVIVEANGTTVVDLNTFTGDATVTVAKWPLAAVGQRVWLTVYGPTGTPLAQLLDGFPITETDGISGISRSITRVQLEGLPAGANIRVELKVNFNGDSSEAASVSFPDANYSVVQCVVEIKFALTLCTDRNGRHIGYGSSTLQHSGYVYGTAPPGASIRITMYLNTAFTHQTYADANGNWKGNWASMPQHYWDLINAASNGSQQGWQVSHNGYDS
jgi:hypothetical protein